MNSERLAKIEDNVRQVRERIAAAANRSDRTAEQVCLVAVSKYSDEAETRALFGAGCVQLGENRPQKFWPKAEALSDLPIEWHFIGHLQRNKLRRTLPLIKLLHSVDSEKTMLAIDRITGELAGDQQNSPSSSPSNVLLEVNTSGDEAKHGLLPAECESILLATASLQHVRVRGLMCMAGLGSGPDGARRDFSALRELREQLQASTGFDLPELSMGMSGDFEIAIEEGATIVRVGSVLLREG